MNIGSWFVLKFKTEVDEAKLDYHLFKMTYVSSALTGVLKPHLNIIKFYCITCTKQTLRDLRWCSFYLRLAEMPGIARVDHRTKCISLVAISLSQNFETRNWPVCSGILNVSLSISPHTPQYTRTTIRAPSHILFKYILGTDPKENTTPLLSLPRNRPRTDQKENAPAA
jgi:hypothetical protein